MYSDRISSFYDLTLIETITFINSKVKYDKDQLIIKAKLDFTNTEHLSTHIYRAISNKITPPKFEELYDFLLDDEMKKQMNQAKINAETEKAKAQFMAWAEAFNSKRKGCE